MLAKKRRKLAISPGLRKFGLTSLAMNRTVLVALFLTSLLSASVNTREGQEIIEQAQSRSDIRELSSFTMKANVKIENQGKLVAGQYVFLWNGPNQWKEEVSFPGFDEIRIGGQGT